MQINKEQNDIDKTEININKSKDEIQIKRMIMEMKVNIITK